MPLQISTKTRILNVFRRTFQIPLVEQVLRTGTERFPNSLLRKFIPPDYLYKANSIRHIDRNGIRYELDISHVVDHYIYFGLRDADFSRVEGVIRTARRILDIGGNIGTSALYFASLNPKASIHSFEPHPQNLRRAYKNLSINSFSHIEMHPFGLGLEESTFKLYEVDPHNPGMNRILHGDQKYPYVEIRVRNLDEVVSEGKWDDIDFIKIDVEGFEYEVLSGAKKTLLKQTPTLFIELDDNHLRSNGKSAAELIELLTLLGYQNIRHAVTGSRLDAHSEFTNCHFDIIAQKSLYDRRIVLRI